VFAQGYSNTSWLLGQPQPIRSRGVASGLRHGSGSRNVSVQANYRDLRSATVPQVTRTLSVHAARAFGPISFDARGEFGENERGGDVRPVRTYNARVSLDGEQASVWVMASRLDHGFQTARTRADVGGELTLGRLQVEAGAGYGKGQLLGNLFTAWSSLDIPLPGRMSLLTGIDYVRWDYDASPYLLLLLDDTPDSPWRFTVGVRRTFALPFATSAGGRSTAARPSSPGRIVSETGGAVAPQ
jgi:hypothetical protein